MKRLFTMILLLCSLAGIAHAQRITRNFQNVSMSYALKYIQQQTGNHKIVFIYNELEDFTVTTSVKNKPVPEAIRQIIGFYPIKMIQGDNNDIYVECTHKTEHHLKGLVVDENNLPLPYANVTLLNPADSTMVGGGVTNESGRFVIPYDHGKVIARITYVGYKTEHRLCNRDNVGTVKMQPQITKLKETVVTAPKMQIRRDGRNYTISNLDGTYLGDAGSLIDMLRWTPGLIVNDENDIKTCDDKSIGEVYIDERKVIDRKLLLSLTSNQVSKIEIIRDLSARYSNPTIKITLKKSLKDYLGLTVASNTTISRRLSEGARANLNAKYKKFSFSGAVNYSISNNKSYDSNGITITNPSDGSLVVENLTDGYFLAHSNYKSWNAGINYFATPQLTLIAQYSGSTGNNSFKHFYHHDMHYLGQDSLIDEMEHEPLSNGSSHNATAGLTYKPNDKRLLTFTLSYSHRESEKESTITLSPIGGDATTNTSYTENRYNLWDGEVNYEFPLLGSTIEVGSNLSWIHNKYSYTYNGNAQPNQRDDFTGAWYASWNHPYGKWNPEFGLRLVYNDTQLEQDVHLVSQQERHTSIHPVASLSYTINCNYQLKAQYSSEDGFPSISMLNPSIIYNSMLDYSKGNPDLKNYTLHYASLNANLKDFSVYAVFNCTLHDIFTAILPYGDDYSIIEYPVNCRYNNMWGLNVSYSHTFGKVSINTSLSGCLFQTKFEQMQGFITPKTNSMSVAAYSQAHWQFCKSGEVYGSMRYSSPRQVDLFRFGRTLGINLGYTQRFFDNRLRVNVEACDLLAQANTPRWSEHYGHISQWQRNRYDTRCLNIRIQYVFNTLDNHYRNARINKQSSSRAD